MKDMNERGLNMNIAILGFGTIGSGVLEISEKMEQIEVVSILDLPQNKDKSKLITSDIKDILENKQIEAVVETMGGLHPAYEFITQCLKHKKHVITANKAVVAKYLDQFLQLAKENDVQFLFEASVGGGIPFLASILKAKRVDALDHFYGIFNGTSNFILDAMFKEEKNFADVLKIAQELGYAEADPKADVEGYDVLNKVLISSALAFDTYVEASDIPTYALNTITLDDVRYLKAKGKCVKYIGEGQVIENQFEGFVMPNIFDSSSVEANISTNFNIITIHGDSIGDLKFYGQGAGKLATANAIVQDIVDIQTKCTYGINIHKTLLYNKEMLHNEYVIRANTKINDTRLAHIDCFENQYYMYTKSITTKQMQELVETISALDTNAFVAKIANFN